MVKKAILLSHIFVFIKISSTIFVPPEISLALQLTCVKNIDIIRHNAVETGMIVTSKTAQITHFVLHDPERIVVDIHQAFFPGISASKTADGKIVSAIRIHQSQTDVVRAVFNVKENTPYNFTIQQKPTEDFSEIKILLSFKLSENGFQASEEAVNPLPGLGQEVLVFDSTLSDGIFENTESPEDESGFSMSGSIYAGGTTQVKEDQSVENNQSLRNRIVLEAKYKKMITVSALSDYLYFGRENSGHEYDLTLHEAKWEHLTNRYGISIGKQIIRWGKTDQISPVDTLNPQDFREFILPDYEERKIPIWMADTRFLGEYFTLEGVLIPFFKSTQWNYFGTNWAVFGNMKKELQNAVSDPALNSFISDLSVHETEPDNEVEFAFKLTSTIKKIDLGLTYHYMIEDNPYYKNFPVKNIYTNGSFSGDGLDSILANPVIHPDEDIEVEYKRTWAAGLEFETTWAGFGLRGETLWMENQSFLTSNLTSSRHPTITAIAGMDYTTTGNTYFNFQALYSHISDFSDDILYFDKNSVALLGEIKQDLVSDRLQGAVKYNISLNNASHYLSPYFKYTYVTNLECIAGIGFFFGDDDTWFGRYREYDFLYLDISYRF